MLFQINFVKNIPEEYDNVIYVTEDNKESLKKIATKSNSPIGLIDSFMSGAKYQCGDGVVTWSEIERKCKAFPTKNPSKFFFWNSHKIYVYLFSIYLNFQIEFHRMKKVFSKDLKVLKYLALQMILMFLLLGHFMEEWI